MDFYVFLNEQIECNEYYTSLLKNVDDKMEECNLKFIESNYAFEFDDTLYLWYLLNQIKITCAYINCEKDLFNTEKLLTDVKKRIKICLENLQWIQS